LPNNVDDEILLSFAVLVITYIVFDTDFVEHINDSLIRRVRNGAIVLARGKTTEMALSHVS